MNLKQSWKLVWVGVCALIFLIFFFSFQGIQNPSWSGSTMGTSYAITLVDRLRPAELQKLKTAVEEELVAVNAQMSTWDPNSEISRFNHFQCLEKFPVSSEFANVVERALKVAELTDGAFDPTVKPLVDHWGFGPKADTEPLAEIMQAVGWKKVRVEEGSLVKMHADVQLDLSAIAKGYGVDAVADVLRRNGIMGFIVEIGGEIVADGMKSNGQPWRVGVESPNAAKGADVFQALELLGGAMATSGDYRNFRIREDGSRFSHIIDPTTGHPAETDIASVSVLAKSCMDADAVATALFVMGSEKSFQWLLALRELEGETYSEFEAFFILHSTNGTFTTRTTDGFPLEP